MNICIIMISFSYFIIHLPLSLTGQLSPLPPPPPPQGATRKVIEEGSSPDLGARILEGRDTPAGRVSPPHLHNPPTTPAGPPPPPPTSAQGLHNLIMAPALQQMSHLLHQQLISPAQIQSLMHHQSVLLHQQVRPGVLSCLVVICSVSRVFWVLRGAIKRYVVFCSLIGLGFERKGLIRKKYPFYNNMCYHVLKKKIKKRSLIYELFRVPSTTI